MFRPVSLVRIVACLAGGLVFPAVPVAGEERAAAVPARPNVVLLYADDLGWTDLACQGSEYYETPHIDRLAEEGTRFVQAYAAAANCAPSRASLMTGAYTPRHQIFTVGNADRGPAKHRKLIPTPNTQVLASRWTTMGDLFQQAGYATCVAGKWHLSEDPTEYGFGTNFGGNRAGHPKSYFSPYHNPDLPDGPPGEHLPERLSRDVCDWIQGHAERPFFVYFPFYSVHTPIQAKPELTARFAGKAASRGHDHPQYAAMIAALDQAVGKVLQTLESLQLEEETLVIFASDNGPHGGVSKAIPLRGSKGMYYEGGIRVPLIVRFPGIVPAGATSQQPIHQVDLLPTLAHVIGAALPEQPIDGINAFSAWRGATLAERPLYWHFPAYLQGYGSQNQGSRYERHWRTTPCAVIREGDWKLIEYFEEAGQPEAFELYNLAEDRGETKNRAAEETEIRDRLIERLHAWQQEVDAPVPSEPNPRWQPASS